MAIKTVSQLDRFDNNIDSKTINIGQNLAFFDGSFLTNRDKNVQIPMLGKDSNSYKVPAYAVGRTKPLINATINRNSDTYWSSLIEISKPNTKSESLNNKTDNADSYDSQHTTYEAILKNILWDVKSYLNYRNNLNDYNLYAIVECDQVFSGDKYLNGGLSVSDSISSYNISATNLTATNSTFNNSLVTNLSAVHLSAIDLSAHNLSIGTSFTIGESVTAINIQNPELFWDGWAYGLKDRDKQHTKTKVGTWNGTITPSLDRPTERTGDPVCFRDGRPYELSCVNCATSAYNIVKPDGKGWNVGTAGYINPLNIPDSNLKTVVKFVNGIPISCNEIDYAHHAYWSDLGERYLADDVYEPGTLVKFGGEKEITIADIEVNAIVSTKAFDLNACLKDGTVIALCGRVPTKVIGKIQKFDKIMLSDNPGIACKWDGKSRVIGRALESNDNECIKLVECVTKFEL